MNANAPTSPSQRGQPQPIPPRFIKLLTIRDLMLLRAPDMPSITLIQACGLTGMELTEYTGLARSLAYAVNVSKDRDAWFMRHNVFSDPTYPPPNIHPG